MFSHQCGKSFYLSQLDALIAANRRLSSRTANVNYLRAYRCPRCRFWHLTKKRNGKDDQAARRRT